MKNIKKLICIVCPNGCHLTVEKTVAGFLVKGNKCPRGEKYGVDEMTDPRRVVTAVIKTSSPDWPCIPVKTSGPVPKKMIRLVLEKLNSLNITLPVRRGQPVVTDFAGTGTDIVCTRTVPPEYMEKRA
jgi:CxxC motif-containing protein